MDGDSRAGGQFSVHMDGDSAAGEPVRTYGRRFSDLRATHADRRGIASRISVHLYAGAGSPSLWTEILAPAGGSPYIWTEIRGWGARSFVHMDGDSQDLRAIHADRRGDGRESPSICTQSRRRISVDMDGGRLARAGDLLSICMRGFSSGERVTRARGAGTGARAGTAARARTQPQSEGDHDDGDHRVEHPPGDRLREQGTQEARAEPQRREPHETPRDRPGREPPAQFGRLVVRDRAEEDDRVEVGVGVEPGEGEGAEDGRDDPGGRDGPAARRTGCRRPAPRLLR